jgi:peptide/nickel transport system permease protein
MGTLGLSIVAIFAAIAILAPVISPYPRTFLVPDSDRFEVASYSRALPANLTFSEPVLGPTTPLASDLGGGMWLINFNGTSGFIIMDFLQNSLRGNESPFRVGNLSLRLDVTQDIGISPPIQLPLTAVYYIVPGQNASQLSGSTIRNGALAIFTARDFVVVDPFDKIVVYRYRLPFTPVWRGEDPASAGRALVVPAQRTTGVGLNRVNVGPYRYFYASDGRQTIVFETVYVHTGDAVRGGAVYPGIPGGQIVLARNETLSASPFIYYNQEQVGDNDLFRSGRGQAILLPLANSTLAVYSTAGRPQKWIPLSIGGEAATVSGSIGHTIAVNFPLWLYVPLRSASSSALAVFDAATFSIVRQVVLRGSGWEPAGSPTSYSGKSIFASFYNAANDTSFVFGLNETFVVIPQFRALFPGRVREFFIIQEIVRVFVFAADGKIYAMDATFSGSTVKPPALFSIVPPPGVTRVIYAGSFSGTIYGINLSGSEVSGVFTDPRMSRTTTFQFLGSPRTPLPPGCYPSGNCYVLGTDFYGADILTELFYGTQVAFTVGLLAALFAVGLGTFIGLIAGYYGKLVETLLMRTTDIVLVLPFLPIVLIFVSILRPSIWIIILTLAILTWPGIARVIRAQVLTLKERPFIDAARVSGASDLRLIFLHLAPNVLPFSFLYMSLAVAGAIITEAALSFLGLGDASVISWGGMLSILLTQGAALYAWWWLLPPGVSITLLSLGFYLLGRGFDEIINPRLRRR